MGRNAPVVKHIYARVQFAYCTSLNGGTRAYTQVMFISNELSNADCDSKIEELFRMHAHALKNRCTFRSA